MLLKLKADEVLAKDRLGFTRDGSLRKRILKDDGEFYDCAVF